MSQIEQGFYPDRYPRRGVPAAPRTGITESLAVPGLAVTPPVISSEAQQFFAAIDAIGNTFGILGHQARQEQAQIESARRDAEVQANEADRLMAGAASLDYRTLLPQIQSDIERGKITDPGDLEAFADRFVAQRTEGQSEAYRTAFAQIKPAIVASFVKRREALQAAADADTLKAYGSAATEATTPEEIGSVLDEARGKFADLSDNDLRGAIVLPALRSAAYSGDSVRFGAALSALGTGFDVERQQAINAFNSTRDGQRADQVRDFHNNIAAGYIDGVPFESIRSRIMKYRGKVPDDVLDQEIRGLESRQAESLRDALKLGLDQELKAKKGEIVARARPVLAAGNQLIDDQTITTADGKEHTFKRAEIIDAAREADFSAIDQKFPLDQPASAKQNLSAKLRWLSRVPDARDPNLEHLWSGIASRITPDTTDALMPPAMVAAYQTFREAEPQAPGVVAAHIKDEDREVLRAASFIQDNIPGITSASALISAVRASNKGVVLSDAISRELSGNRLQKALTSELDGDASNLSDASRIIERRARAYVLAYGASEQAAIEESVKRFKEDYSLANGHYVNTVQRPVAKSVNLNLMGEAVVNSWAKKTGEDPANYTLIPDRDSTSWYIAQAGLAVPAPGTPRISDAEIMALNQWWNAMDATDAEDRLLIAARKPERETDFVGVGSGGQAIFRRDLENLQAYWNRDVQGPSQPDPAPPTARTPEPPMAASTREALTYLLNKRLIRNPRLPKPPITIPRTSREIRE
jgi:hypothetical protein